MLVLHELNDPRLDGFPSITRVKVSADLSVADVYVTSMGTPGKQKAALDALRQSGSRLRSMLMESLPIRQVPFLRFHDDERLKKELEVMQLLDDVSRESAEREDQADPEASAPEPPAEQQP